MRKLMFVIVSLGLFSVFYPGLADAGMYGEVYIPSHEFVGFMMKLEYTQYLQE